MPSLDRRGSFRKTPSNLHSPPLPTLAPPQASCLLNQVSVKSLIDLRSPAELKDDDKLHASSVYEGCINYFFDKKKLEWREEGVTKNGAVAKETASVQNGRKRFFVSLMSESLIKRGVFFRFRKRIRVSVSRCVGRVFVCLLCLFVVLCSPPSPLHPRHTHPHQFQALAWLALSNFSRRAEKKVRSIFIDRINGGGLSLLNELVVDYSGKEIIAVLKLIAEKSNYPIALYCTAGKDRTGLIAMLTLSVLGATDDEIIADYVLSDKAYAEINDSKAMVVGMAQTGVDPNIFLRANPQVIIDSIRYIRTTFGSIDGFLDHYGFDLNWRMRLRSSLLE